MESMQESQPSQADVTTLRARDARRRNEFARVQSMSVELQSGPVSRFSTASSDDVVSARDKALRDLDDFKRASGEAGTCAKSYRRHAEAAEAGVDLLARENDDLKTKLTELQRRHASLRREAEAAVTEERRRSAANLQEQLSRLQGPAGFDALKRDNLALQERISGLEHQHGDLVRQAQAAINAAEERARASEAGRAAAYDLGRRLEAQLSTVVMDHASKFHQAVAVGPPAVALAGHGSRAVLPSPPVRQQQQQQQHPQQHPQQQHPQQQHQPSQQQQVPRHLRDIEKWFDGIPERFRGNVRAAKLGKHLKDNVNNKQGLEDAIAEVKKLTIQVSPLIPRSVRSHILRGPEGWTPSSPYPPEGMSEPSSVPVPASAPILSTAFGVPGMITTTPATATTASPPTRTRRLGVL